MSELDWIIVAMLALWLLAHIRAQLPGTMRSSLLTRLLRPVVLAPWRLFGPNPSSFDCCVQYRWRTTAGWCDWQTAYAMPRPSLHRALWNPQSRIKTYVHTASLWFVFSHLGAQRAGREEDRALAAHALETLVSTLVPEVYEHSWQFRVTSYHGRAHRNKLSVAYTSDELPCVGEVAR